MASTAELGFIPEEARQVSHERDSDLRPSSDREKEEIIDIGEISSKEEVYKRVCERLYAIDSKLRDITLLDESFELQERGFDELTQVPFECMYWVQSYLERGRSTADLQYSIQDWTENGVVFPRYDLAKLSEAVEVSEMGFGGSELRLRDLIRAKALRAALGSEGARKFIRNRREKANSAS